MTSSEEVEGWEEKHMDSLDRCGLQVSLLCCIGIQVTYFVLYVQILQSEEKSLSLLGQEE